ncbi:hypothetical protein JYU19_02435 [bacterium AH-315-J21]|nr:hypothetical protein [bacterium AH-315-J21]
MHRFAKIVLQAVLGLALIVVMTSNVEARTWAESNISSTASGQSGSNDDSGCGCNESKKGKVSTSYRTQYNDPFEYRNARITDECNDFIHCIGGYSCLVSALKCAGSDMILFSEIVRY